MATLKSLEMAIKKSPKAAKSIESLKWPEIGGRCINQNVCVNVGKRHVEEYQKDHKCSEKH